MPREFFLLKGRRAIRRYWIWIRRGKAFFDEVCPKTGSHDERFILRYGGPIYATSPSLTLRLSFSFHSRWRLSLEEISRSNRAKLRAEQKYQETVINSRRLHMGRIPFQVCRNLIPALWVEGGRGVVLTIVVRLPNRPLDGPLLTHLVVLVVHPRRSLVTELIRQIASYDAITINLLARFYVRPFDKAV